MVSRNPAKYATSCDRDIAIDGLRAGLRLNYSVNCLASRAIERGSDPAFGIDNSCTLGGIPPTPKLAIQPSVGKDDW
jgi:hypothetical protein